MAADVNVSDCFGDLGHVTSNTFVARTGRTVVRVLFDAGGMRPVLRVGAVAGQAKGVALLAHNSRIVGAMRIVTIEAGDAARIHQALDEIITLHPVLVRRSVGEVGEGRFAELVFVQLPEVPQVQADMKADRPVVVFSFDRIFQRPAL